MFNLIIYRLPIKKLIFKPVLNVHFLTLGPSTGAETGEARGLSIRTSALSDNTGLVTHGIYTAGLQFAQRNDIDKKFNALLCRIVDPVEFNWIRIRPLK